MEQESRRYISFLEPVVLDLVRFLAIDCLLLVRLEDITCELTH